MSTETAIKNTLTSININLENYAKYYAQSLNEHERQIRSEYPVYSEVSMYKNTAYRHLSEIDDDIKRLKALNHEIGDKVANQVYKMIDDISCEIEDSIQDEWNRRDRWQHGF